MRGSTFELQASAEGNNVSFDILDLVWRDFDRMARAGATPLQLLADPGSWVIAAHRIGRALHALPAAIRAPFLLAYRPWEVALSALAGMTLPVNAEIGGGLRLNGTGGILVSPKAHIGRDCDLTHGAVLAETETGAPWLGDRVHVGAGARIVGGVRIGNDARIGACAVVDRDVPDGGVVGGILAVVETVRGRRRPPLLDPLRRAVRSLLPRPTQLLLRAG
jgi:serine O-acetyltransferase